MAMQWIRDGGKRRKGRPVKTWRTRFQEDLQEMGVIWTGVHRVIGVVGKVLSPDAVPGVGESTSD